MIHRKSSEPSDTDILKVHFDKQGRSYAASGDRPPRPSEELHKLIGQHRTVRVAGTPNNWAWISGQYLLTRSRRLEIVGSSISREQADKVGICFVSLRNASLPGSLGGRFFPRSQDLLLYSAGATTYSKGSGGGAEARDWLRDSPLSVILRWIDTFQEDATAELISKIVDPRLWISTKDGKEHSAAPIEQWFGLTPEGWKDFVRDRGDLAVHPGIRSVLDCWYDPGRRRALDGNPCRFLYRILDASNTFEKGAVRACQAFVRLLRHAWMACLYPQADLDSVIGRLWKTDQERGEFREVWDSFVVRCRKESKPTLDETTSSG